MVLRPTAEMDDLEAAILNRQGTIQAVQQQVLHTLPNAMNVEHDVSEPQPELREPAAAVSVSAATDDWPPRVNDCVVGLFEDGFYPGGVLFVTGESAEINFECPL